MAPKWHLTEVKKSVQLSVCLSSHVTDLDKTKTVSGVFFLSKYFLHDFS